MSDVLSSSTGISKSLLDQIDLQEYDVIQGKKYIGRDGTLHTGTLEDQPNDNQCPVITQYDPGTGFVYLALPRGAYRRTDGRMSPHPNMKRRLMEIVSEAGFNRGAWSTTINPGGSVAIPQGFHNGAGRVYANNVQSQLKRGTVSHAFGGGDWAQRATLPCAGTVIGITDVRGTGSSYIDQSVAFNNCPDGRGIRIRISGSSILVEADNLVSTNTMWIDYVYI